VAWPGVEVSRAEIAAFVAGEETEISEVADVYLACACARGESAALRAFEEHFLAQVPAFVSRLRLSAAEVDEVTQALRQRLLMPGTNAPPKIALYRGRGKLGSWVRVAAIREAHTLRREDAKGAAAEAAEDLADQISSVSSPELEYMRARYCDAFVEAIREAIAALEPRQRSLLDMHVSGGLNGEEIGAIFGVNRSTVSRWLGAVREELFARTSKILRDRLRLSESEFESVANLLQSQLDVSLRVV
jgi:RNA polymerase sigma-70 factor (ECF subfamily)